jgi:hypothetical protein
MGGFHFVFHYIEFSVLSSKIDSLADSNAVLVQHSQSLSMRFSPCGDRLRTITKAASILNRTSGYLARTVSRFIEEFIVDMVDKSKPQIETRPILDSLFMRE